MLYFIIFWYLVFVLTIAVTKIFSGGSSCGSKSKEQLQREFDEMQEKSLRKFEKLMEERERLKKIK